MLALRKAETGILPDARQRRAFEPDAKSIYATAACLIAFLTTIVVFGRFSADGALVGRLAADTALALAFAYAARWLGFRLIAGLAEMLALSVLCGTLVMFASAALAATALPLADDALAAADRLLFGFDRRAFAHEFAARPRIAEAMSVMYNAFLPAFHLLMVLLFATGRERQAWRTFTALTIAPCIALCIFPLLPAFGTPPYAYAFEDVFRGLRNGSLRSLDREVLTGIITFPSLHAAGGAILAWSYARLGRFAVPMVVVGVGIVLSAITSGGHYGVDVLAGLLVAAAAIILAGRLVIDQPSSASDLSR